MLGKWKTWRSKFGISYRTKSNQRHHVRAADNLDDHNPPLSDLHFFLPPGLPKVMQHAVSKSIDLSRSFRKDWAPHLPLPLFFPGVRWWVFVCFHALLCSSICLCVDAVIGQWAYQGSGRPGTLASFLSRFLRPYTFLIALVIWLFGHELCLMTPTLQWGLSYREERQADRLLWLLSVCQAIRKTHQCPKAVGFFAVGVNIFSNLSVGVYEIMSMVVSLCPCGELVTCPPGIHRVATGGSTNP